MTATPDTLRDDARLTVVHHAALQARGGAARVARLLHAQLLRRGMASAVHFEFDEGSGDVGTLVSPVCAGADLPPDAVLHLHSSGNWRAVLGNLLPGQKAVLTLHDAAPLTGGCPYPLDCPGAVEGCLSPCPRGYPDASTLQAANLALLDQQGPALVSPSRWLANLAGRVLPRHRVRVIPNGIPWPRRPLSKGAARQELGILPQARVVLFVAHGGVSAQYKSGDRWLQYWQAVKAARPDALGFVVGGDSTGRDDDLLFWPYVDRERLALLMAAADVLVSPSRADNHPLVVLEAMAAKLPVAAFAVGGIPEQVVHGRTGVLVRPGDHNMLVVETVRLLSDSSLVRRLGETAHEHGASRFTDDRMAIDYIRLYKSLNTQ